MARIVIAGQGSGKADLDGACLSLGRSLRDAGHEVVHAGTDPGPERLVAVALAEDVAVVVLVAAGAGTGDPAAEVSRLLREQHAEDVAVVVVGEPVGSAAVLEAVAAVAGGAPGRGAVIPPRDPPAGPALPQV